MPRRGLDAEDALAHLGDVEIDLHDPALAPQPLDQQGEARLEALPQPGAPGPEEDVLRHLLADRAAAAQPAVVRQRRADAVEVEAPVPAEVRVLGRGRRQRQVVGHVVEADPVALDRAEPPPLARHQVGQRRIDEAEDGDEQHRQRQRRQQHARHEPQQAARRTGPRRSPRRTLMADSCPPRSGGARPRRRGRAVL